MVHSDSQHVFNHSRQVPLEQVGALFDAGVGVYFNEPHVEVLVKDEVVAEQFEAMLPGVGV